MSKRRKTQPYEEWHFKRTQAAYNVNEEWTLALPRPARGLPAGRYNAIEIHSIEYIVGWHFRDEGPTTVNWSITTSPRTGNTPFITDCGDPSNLWFYKDTTWGPVEHGAFIEFQATRLKNIARFTDDMGHGKLVIGDQLFLQVGTANVSTVYPFIHFAIEYTFTSVNCDEYAQNLTSQLMVG